MQSIYLEKMCYWHCLGKKYKVSINLHTSVLASAVATCFFFFALMNKGIQPIGWMNFSKYTVACKNIMRSPCRQRKLRYLTDQVWLGLFYKHFCPSIKLDLLGHSKYKRIFKCMISLKDTQNVLIAMGWFCPVVVLTIKG